jgi:hypothetical protein
LNNVGHRRPPPVRRGKGKGKGEMRGSISLNNVAMDAKQKIANSIAQRKANSDALYELKEMGLKNLTFKQRKALQKKKGTALNDNTLFRVFDQSKKNHSKMNQDLLRNMEKHIPKGLIENEKQKKLYTNVYTKTFKNFYDKHVDETPEGHLTYRHESPTPSDRYGQLTPPPYRPISPPYRPRTPPSPPYRPRTPPSPPYIPIDTPPGSPRK